MDFICLLLLYLLTLRLWLIDIIWLKGILGLLFYSPFGCYLNTTLIIGAIGIAGLIFSIESAKLLAQFFSFLLLAYGGLQITKTRFQENTYKVDDMYKTMLIAQSEIHRYDTLSDEQKKFFGQNSHISYNVSLEMPWIDIVEHYTKIWDDRKNRHLGGKPKQFDDMIWMD